MSASVRWASAKRRSGWPSSKPWLQESRFRRKCWRRSKAGCTTCCSRTRTSTLPRIIEGSWRAGSPGARSPRPGTGRGPGKGVEMQEVKITVTVNGIRHTRQVEPRMLLSDFLRHELGLTGTHVGCEHGVCGACTVLIDGRSARSCLTLAVQAEDCEVETVE